MGIPSWIELSERIGHEAIISLLNQYFTRLAEPISEAGGFIDSFRGDEVMALFGGTPESAVEAGIGMHRAWNGSIWRSRTIGRPCVWVWV